MFYKILKKLKLNNLILEAAGLYYKSGIYTAKANTKKCEAKLSDKAYSEVQNLHEGYCSGCINNNKIKADKKFDLKIVVPAYNVERYIRRCLNSIAQQETKYSYGVTVVDDGSTDNTGAIADEYANSPNFCIIHQENKGLSGARNAAMSVIDSKYVMFVDSDDFLPQGAVETLMDSAMKNDADVVEGSHCFINDNDSVFHCVTHKEGRLDPMKDGRGFAWGKVIKFEYFDKVDFPVGYWYEDSVICQIIYPLVKKNNGIFIGCRNVTYYYRKHPMTISKIRSNPKCADTLLISLDLAKDRRQLGLCADRDYFEHMLDMVVISYDRTKELNDEIRYDIFIVFADFFEKNFGEMRTQRRNRALLDRALKNRDYNMYICACRLG